MHLHLCPWFRASTDSVPRSRGGSAPYLSAPGRKQNNSSIAKSAIVRIIGRTAKIKYIDGRYASVDGSAYCSARVKRERTRVARQRDGGPAQRGSDGRGSRQPSRAKKSYPTRDQELLFCWIGRGIHNRVRPNIPIVTERLKLQSDLSIPSNGFEARKFQNVRQPGGAVVELVRPKRLQERRDGDGTHKEHDAERYGKLDHAEASHAACMSAREFCTPSQGASLFRIQNRRSSLCGQTEFQLGAVAGPGIAGGNRP